MNILKKLLYILTSLFFLFVAIGISNAPALNSTPASVKAEVIAETPPVNPQQPALSMTPDQLIKAEHKNKARFIRDLVGKTIKVTGIVRSVSDGFFTFDAQDSFAGWTVYIHDNDFLANLDEGQKISITCKIADIAFIGGNSNCDE